SVCGDFSKSEVENFDLPTLSNHYVLRFDVPVYDATSMSPRQCVSYLHCDLKGFFQLKRFPLNAYRESLAVDVLHHDQSASTIVADFVDCADVRMVKRCRGAGFPNQPFICVVILG